MKSKWLSLESSSSEQALADWLPPGLKKAPAEITLIDRTNHHVFQPLLYQVATSVLSPSQIGFPIRGILGRQNTTVLQGEVTGQRGSRLIVNYRDAAPGTAVGKSVP